MYEVELQAENPESSKAFGVVTKLSEEDRQNRWHSRIVHISKGKIQKSIPLVDGVEIRHCADLPSCDPYMKTKPT